MLCIQSENDATACCVSLAVTLYMLNVNLVCVTSTYQQLLMGMENIIPNYPRDSFGKFLEFLKGSKLVQGCSILIAEELCIHHGLIHQAKGQQLVERVRD